MRFSRKLTSILILLVVAGPMISEESCSRLLSQYNCHNILSETVLRNEMSLIAPLYPSMSLKISNSSLPELNQNILKIVNFTKLKIEANVKIIRGHAFENCSIIDIALDNNAIQEIENYGFNSSVLETISLYNNSLKQILEKQFAGAYNLVELNLGNNRIVDVQPYAFKDLQSLEKMDLSHNLLNHLPFNIFRTTKYLLEIHLNDNHFKILPTDLFIENNQLKTLDLGNNNLITFDGSKFPKSLTNINLQSNNITSFNISNLIKLLILELNSNKLTNIENSFLHANSLQNLNLGNNSLGSFLSVKTFKGLQKLVRLDLSYNNIYQFDVSYINDSKETLDALILRGNLITDIINVSLLKNLNYLDMSYNQIKEITYDTFENLNNLAMLSLEHNLINKLAIGCFRDLKSLEKLNLSYNKLDYMPTSTLNGLHYLQSLDLSDNKLTTLNEDIFHSNIYLKYLNIANNHIRNIDVRGIISTTLLRNINLTGNHLSCTDLVGIIKLVSVRGLVTGSSFNVSNVNGIPCNETDDSEEIDYVTLNKNIFSVLNQTMIVTREMSGKFNVIIVLLFLIILLSCVKVMLEKCSGKIKVAKQFVYKNITSEHELQLNVVQNV